MAQNPNSRSVPGLHPPKQTPHAPVRCPLCDRMPEPVPQATSTNVVCQGCGFTYALPAAKPPGQAAPPKTRPTSDSENPLDCWLAGDPIQPRQISDWQRVRSWCGRRPALATGFAATGFTILAIAVVSTIALLAALATNRQDKHSLASLGQQNTQAEHRLQSAEALLRRRLRETNEAASSCQLALGQQRKTEKHLADLQRRHELLEQERNNIAAEVRLAFARDMAAQGRRLLAAAPARSLLLAQRSTDYLNAQGYPVEPMLEQTLRDALVLAGAQSLRGHSGPVESLAVSPDGRWLLTASVDSTVRLWDLHASSIQENSELLQGHHGPVRHALISPDSQWAVATADDGRVVIWDIQSPDPGNPAAAFSAHQGRIHRLAISPDSRWLAVAGAGGIQQQDNCVRLWDVSQLVGETALPSVPEPLVLRGYLGPVRALAVTPDCHWLVTGSEDKTIRLFDLTSHCPAASQVVLRGHDGAVTSLAVSPDSRWMVTGSHDGTARLWDLTEPQSVDRSIVLTGHKTSIHRVAISPTGRWLATAAGDQTCRLWDMNAVDPSSSCRVLTGHQADIGPILFSPDGRLLITGSSDRTVRLWPVESSDSTTDAIVLRGHRGPVAAIAVTPNGRTVLTGCRAAADHADPLVRRFDLPIDSLLDVAESVVSECMTPAEQEQILLQTARHRHPTAEAGQCPIAR